MSKETLWYAENAFGYVYFASQMSDLKPGFALRSTSSPKEMDRIFARMHQQERDHNEKFLERLYNRDRQKYTLLREGLKARLGSAEVAEAEKGIIREALKLMDAKDSASQENHAYGVSAMQEAPAPLPAPRTRIM